MSAPRSRSYSHVGFWAAALLALLLFLALFREILLPFVGGIAMAYFLNPAADALERGGLNRSLAAVLLIGGSAVLLGFALMFLAPLVIEQIKALSATLPTDMARLRVSLEQFLAARLGIDLSTVQAAIKSGMADLQAAFGSTAGQVASAVINRGVAFVNVLSLLLITPLVAFYLLVDWHRMLATVSDWLPRHDAATIRRLAGEIDQSVAAFIRGQGTICIILGVFYAVGLSLVGLRYGLIVGVGTGLAAFVPVVGWLLGFLVAIGLALAQFGGEWLPIVLVAAVLLAGMAIDTAFLSPRLVGERIGLHPVWLIFALFAFSYLFGFVGTLIAVPLAAATVVLVRYALEQYRASVYFQGPASDSGTPS
jgi:predicted PurR-regulated permease PerM